jgi:hypothetical protein
MLNSSRIATIFRTLAMFLIDDLRAIFLTESVFMILNFTSLAPTVRKISLSEGKLCSWFTFLKKKELHTFRRYPPYDVHYIILGPYVMCLYCRSRFSTFQQTLQFLSSGLRTLRGLRSCQNLRHSMWRILESRSHTFLVCKNQK